MTIGRSLSGLLFNPKERGQEGGVKGIEAVEVCAGADRVCNTGGGPFVEGSEVEFNLLRDKKAAEVLQDGSDVVMRVGVSEEGGSRVLDAQEFIEDFGG